MKKMKFLLMFVIFTISANAQTNWVFDKSHTTIGFGVTHLIISEVTGRFESFDGSVTSKSDDFQDADIEFEIDAKSINTDNKKRDEHLSSDDFFNADKFPKLIFKSTSMKKVGENRYKLVGNFTMRDITKQIELEVKLNGVIKDPYGNTKAGFKITGALDRFDYGLKWNSLMEAGGAVVGKTVTLYMNVELQKK
ncbi:MAG: YceI family protein [Ignavibacteriaceae bacterium]|nr:YceI family protein [Ignavibacteriaceae bacterium]